MTSGGVFTLLSADSTFPDTTAYLPLTGYLSTEFVAPILDQDAMVTEAQHTSVEQVIARDQTLTGMYANFGSTTDLAGRTLIVEITLLVSTGGTELLTPRASCYLDVPENGPMSKSCPWSDDQAVPLHAGDVAVLYVHPYVINWEPNTPVQIYGTVTLTS